jgi:hypothetical protein
MVLSDRFAGKTPRSLLKRTLLYVLAFGLGSLLIASILGFAMVSIAEGVLPAPKDSATAPRKPGEAKDLPGKAKSAKPGAKLKTEGEDEASDKGKSDDEPAEETEQPL